MGFVRKTRNFLRPFFCGCIFGVLLVYGGIMAERYGLIEGLFDLVYAATGTIRPDGVGNFTDGTPTTCGTANNFDCLNDTETFPTAPTTTVDFLVQTSAQTDSFTMDNSLTDVATATRLRVYVYHQEGGTNMSLNVSLWNAAETVQIATTSSFTRTTAGWDVADKGGLTLAQSDITGLRVRINCTKGGGKGSDCTSFATYVVVDYDQLIDVTVSSLGTHRNRIDIGTTTAYTGGAFVFTENTAGNHDITQIQISELGTVDANNDLFDVRLYYENAANCSTASFDGTEFQYGGTTTFSGNVATFSDTGIGVSAASQLCIYPVLGVSTTATYGQTLQLEITDPSTDVTGSGAASIEPDTPVGPTSFSTLEQAAPVQTRYHWRQDNGDEGDTILGADSFTGGNENTSIDSATKDTHYRLRLQVDNEGNATTTGIQYRLEYGVKTTDCSALAGGDWVDVHATVDDWDMVNSNDVTVNDGNTTNITSSAKGAIADPGGGASFNDGGGLRESTSLSGSITLDPTQFTELEYSLNASSSIVDGTTYCFRVTNNGSPLYGYTTYPEITFNADVTVSAEEAQPSTISIPTTDNLLGSFLFSSTTAGSQDVGEITIAASTTAASITEAFDNIRLYWEYDSSAPADCVSESFSGFPVPTETQYGTTDADGFDLSGNSTFTQALLPPSVNTTRALCLYVVLDVTATSSDGDKLDIKINDPSTEVVLSAGTVAPANVVDLSGVTTLTSPYVDLLHYHWRNNEGTEANASSSVGAEDTAFAEMPANTVQRLRVGVANTGGETTGNYQYQLEWGQKVTDCDSIATWHDIDTGGDEWSIVASQLVDNADTTNISTTTGGVTNVGTFLSTNGGQQDVDGQTNNIDLPSNGWLELEYSIQADSTAPEGANYCFRVTNNGAVLNNYTIYPEASIKLATDFAVYRDSISITGTSTTLVEGVDYDLQFNSSTRAFIRLTNTHMTGSGPAAGTASNANSDDTTVFIENPGNIETSVTIRRALTAPVGDTRITWEVIEYIGELGGENEMYVHDAGVISVTGTNLTGTSSAVTGGVTNDGQIVPFITAQYNNDTGRLNYNYGLFTSSWNSGADTVSVARGQGGSDASVSYAVVEFRGANWNVWRVQEDYQVTPGNTDTQSFGPLQTGDISKAFIHSQHRVANGQDDHASFGHEAWLSSFGAVSFRLNGILPGGDEADHVSVAWVVENTQTAGDVMFVQQKASSIPNGGGGLTIANVDLTYQIGDLTTASLFVNNSNNDTGRSYPESMISAEIISDTQVQLQVSDDLGENLYRIQVVEWPTAAAKLIQNDFWLYEDNDNLTPTTPWGGLSENEEMTANDTPIASGQNIRIRMSLTVTAAALPAGVDAFKLQYGERVTTCDAVATNSNWYNLGEIGSTTTLWRGHDSAPADGSQVTTSFILSESTVAGTYEEQNDSVLVPSQSLVGDVVEYDWNIEDSGAVDKTDYCFRMVYANEGALESYSTYPVIRTVGYGPEIGDWRWFDDETNLTPSTPLDGAATNTAPANVAFNNGIKLRAIVTEKAGASGNPAKFKLQYSEYPNFSQGVYDVVSTSTCTASSTWCYFDGAGIDNATITQNVLGGITGTCIAGSGTGCGTHNEGSSSSTATLVQPAYSSQEFEFTIVHAGARANAVYYFRLFNVVDNEVIPASSTLPSLVTEGASLTFTVDGLPSGTDTEGVTLDDTTSSSSIAFSSIQAGSQYEVGHRITVDTNATEGYQVLVYADQLLTNSYGSTIPAFVGTNASPLGWGANCTDNCFGYHAGDDLLDGGSARFGANDTYAALSTTTPGEIMYSSVPTVESHDIVYKIQVDETLPAGDYQANINYIAIPVF